MMVPKILPPPRGIIITGRPLAIRAAPAPLSARIVGRRNHHPAGSNTTTTLATATVTVMRSRTATFASSPARYSSSSSSTPMIRRQSSASASPVARLGRGREPASAPWVGGRRSFCSGPGGSSAPKRRTKPLPHERPPGGDRSGDGGRGRRVAEAATASRASATSSSSSSSSSTGGAASASASASGIVATDVLPRILAGFALSFVVVPAYVCDVVMCDGPSMIPTVLPRGEIVFVEKASHRILGFDGGGGSCVGEERAGFGREERARREREERIRRRAEGKRKKRSSESKRSEDEGGSTSRSPRPGRRERSRSTDIPTPVVVDDDEASWSWPRKLYSKLTTGLSRGDVVVAQHPQRDGTVCKRILGLPGDVIVRNRNDPDYKYGGAMVVVPDGHVWLEGDNPSNSTDSRSYGAVPAALVEGRVWLRIWPLRGDAVMDRRRPRPPRPPPPPPRADGETFDDGRKENSNVVGNSSVLPAGYDGTEDDDGGVIVARYY